MSTNNLSPTELAKAALAQAEQIATEAEWKEYLEAQKRHRVARFDPNEKFSNYTHGRPGTYSHGCRCAECRESWRLYMNERNKKIREANPTPRNPPKGREGRTVKPHMHGTLTGYAYGCRCEECTTAHRVARPKRGVTHGTPSAYRKKCRCRKCVKANAERVKPYRKAHYERKKLDSLKES